MKKRILFYCFLVASLSLFSQEYFPINSGVKEPNENFMAFTNAIIYVTPTRVLENATLLIQKGRVVDVGNAVNIPANTVVVDLKGKYVYPSFIDLYTDFGIDKPQRTAQRGRSPQYEATRSGYYWNDHIMPEVNGYEKFSFDAKKADEFQTAGFGVVNTHLQDGIARGTGALVTLNKAGNDSERLLAKKAAQHFSFAKSAVKNQSYPGSVMGAMALLRQMYYDADWYAKGNAKTKDLALEALLENRNLTSIFDAGNKLNVLRADKVGDLFNIQYVILGSGYEFEHIGDVKATNATFLLPVNFPSAYDVSNPYQASYITLQEMKRWNQAPFNPKVMADNNIKFAFTSHGLKSVKEFRENISKAIAHGLDKTKALEALTTVPAGIIGKSADIGTLNKGAYANFLITSGDVFEKETTLFENWVQGQRHVINDMTQKDIRGTYALQLAGNTYSMELSGELSKPKVEVSQDTLKLKSNLSYSRNWINLSLEKDEETYRMTAIVPETGTVISGKAVLPNGLETTFTARKTSDTEEKEKEKEKKSAETPEMIAVTFPNMAYGNSSKPKAQSYLFRNATVWTGEDEGILENTDVLIQNGKITRIGKNLSASGAQVIDATGKHLTAGIIDEHSHLALSSVNEGGHNSSAEVKMEDVVDPDDIGIYRALAGGVTSAQLLHGSANPIGGRSAIVKFKWGASADEMIYKNSPKYIKFALGENVKQSNWGATETVRFPQSRMGVEQVFTDYFQRAKEYEAEKKSGKAFRYDEEMETLLEILNGERFISCHSYVQSEINMLMKVADNFGFTVQTFTHILEGYKVADKMKAHGVGASTFSDWWAYKYEVNDAIPYNAAIMYHQGVTVAINSDDGEMIRRLNQEAAKTVKYGGVPEYEAWKMVTINPAKLLRIDDRVGSIKTGKDADVVLWNDHPLSIYAKPEKTLIDGVVYFDSEEDKMKRQQIKTERNELIHLMLNDKNGGDKKRTPTRRPSRDFHCDTEHFGVDYEIHAHESKNGLTH